MNDDSNGESWNFFELFDLQAVPKVVHHELYE